MSLLQKSQFLSMAHFFLLGEPFLYFLPSEQISLFKHPAHLGWTGKHVCCPNPTSNRLISAQCFCGSQLSRATRVCSGCLVGLGSHLRRLVMRCTWVSTPIPQTSPQADFITRYAILGPTPDKLHSPLMSWGISPANLSRRISLVFLMNFTLLWKKIESK